MTSLPTHVPIPHASSDIFVSRPPSSDSTPPTTFPPLTSCPLLYPVSSPAWGPQLLVSPSYWLPVPSPSFWPAS
jgi:hypothetical protein